MRRSHETSSLTSPLLCVRQLCECTKVPAYSSLSPLFQRNICRINQLGLEEPSCPPAVEYLSSQSCLKALRSHETAWLPTLRSSHSMTRITTYLLCRLVVQDPIPSIGHDIPHQLLHLPRQQSQIRQILGVALYRLINERVDKVEDVDTGIDRALEPSAICPLPVCPFWRVYRACVASPSSRWSCRREHT